MRDGAMHNRAKLGCGKHAVSVGKKIGSVDDTAPKLYIGTAGLEQILIFEPVLTASSPKVLTETAQIPAEIPRFVTRPAFARLAGVSPVAIHKQVKGKLAAACENGLIDRESPEALAYLQNRTSTRTAHRPHAPKHRRAARFGPSVLPSKNGRGRAPWLLRPRSRCWWPLST